MSRIKLQVVCLPTYYGLNPQYVSTSIYGFLSPFILPTLIKLPFSFLGL